MRSLPPTHYAAGTSYIAGGSRVFSVRFFSSVLLGAWGAGSPAPAPALGPVFGTVAVACGRELFQAVMGLAPFLPCFRNLSVLLTIRLIVLSIDSVLTARWSIATVFDSFGSESYRVYSF